MKNRVLNYIVYGIITMTFISCMNKSESKSNIKIKKELNNESKNEFVYVESGKKIELILENNIDFLVVGQPTKTKFKTENIDSQKLMIYGPGIMVNRKSKDGFRFTITPIEETLVNGKLEIQITERIENGENFTHKFLVPVKAKTE